MKNLEPQSLELFIRPFTITHIERHMQCDDQMSIKVKFVRSNVSKHELLEHSYHKSTILLMTISSSNLGMILARLHILRFNHNFSATSYSVEQMCKKFIKA